MDDSGLPDDPGQWPADPFELLGVPDGAAETDIKRAYTRLIRRFKPEHYPEQFRRVREAYDACLERRRWFFPREAIEPDVRAAPVARPDNTPLDDSSPEFEAQSAGEHPLPEPRAVDEADRLWNEAIEGRTEAAYAGLVELASARPDDAGIALRLYWLLSSCSQLDNRTRHSWLAEALKRSALSGPAAELYRRELEADPLAGLYDPYLNLLSTGASASALLTVARWRLDAAGQSLSWHPLKADFEVLSQRLPFENEAGWLGYLSAGLDWTVWESPHPIHGLYRRELGRLRHLELSHSYIFDRIEAAERVSVTWREATGFGEAPGFLALVPPAWAGYGRLAPASLAPIVPRLAADPATALYRLDRIVWDHGPSLLVLVAEALEAHRRSRLMRGEPEYPADFIRAVARGLKGWWRTYSELRDELLDLLLGESIHPLEFAAACGADPDDRLRRIAEQVHRDLPLGLVWLACRIQQENGSRSEQ